MPRETTETIDPDVEVVTSEEGEELVANGPEGSEEKPKEPKPKKEPARGDLPEGYVTPVGLAKELSTRGLQKDRDGNVVTDVKPQMVYSYIKNASKEDPFPTEEITDSIGAKRNAMKLDTAIEWWERKNNRAEERKTNAANKVKAKEEKAAKAAETKEAEASSEGETTTEPATETVEAE